MKANGDKLATAFRGSFLVKGVRIWVEVSATSAHVHRIEIDADGGRLESKGAAKATSRMGRLAERRLKAYFDNPGAEVDLPLWPHEDSDNQRAAMDFLRSIPLGEQRSYAQQAQSVRARCGNGFNARNAGTANRGNRYPLAVPCHRVVRSDGDVGGFMGSGKESARRLKRALLEHEASARPS